MKITILIPSWNADKYILRAIDSITNNGWTDYEIRIMDNNSDDKTSALVQGLKNSRIIFTPKKDHGMYEALNRGIAEAKGEIIGWIGADDQLVKHSLAHVAKAFEDSAVKWLVGDGTFLFESEGNKTVDHRLSATVTVNKLVMGNLLISPSVYFRKSFFESVGGFNQRYKLAADYDLWIKYALLQQPYVVHRPLSIFSYNNANASSKRKIEMYKETIQILQSVRQPKLRLARTINILRMHGYMAANKIRGQS